MIKIKKYLSQTLAHLGNLGLLSSSQVADLAGRNARPDLHGEFQKTIEKSSKNHRKSLKTYFSTSDSLAGSDDRAGGNGSSFANVGTVQDGYTLANQTIIINGAGVDNGSVLNDNILANSSGKIVINVDGHIVLNVRLFSHLDASEIGYQYHAQLQK